MEAEEAVVVPLVFEVGAAKKLAKTIKRERLHHERRQGLLVAGGVHGDGGGGVNDDGGGGGSNGGVACEFMGL